MARTDRVAPTGLSSKGIVRLRLFNTSLTNTMLSFGARVGPGGDFDTGSLRRSDGTPTCARVARSTRSDLQKVYAGCIVKYCWISPKSRKRRKTKRPLRTGGACSPPIKKIDMSPSKAPEPYIFSFFAIPTEIPASRCHSRVRERARRAHQAHASSGGCGYR